MTALAKLSPRELREYKPRLRFEYRCPNCKAEWVGAANEGYCCGMYAVEIEDEDEE